MAKRALVDSSYFIAHLRENRDPLEELAVFSDRWELLTCGVVKVEVLRGMKHKNAHRRMANYLDCMLYIPTLDPLWERTHKLAWELDRRGIIMQLTDLVIAACALESNAAVLTLDGDFRRVPGLRVLEHLL